MATDGGRDGSRYPPLGSGWLQTVDAIVRVIQLGSLRRQTVEAIVNVIHRWLPDCARDGSRYPPLGSGWLRKLYVSKACFIRGIPPPSHLKLFGETVARRDTTVNRAAPTTNANQECS